MRAVEEGLVELIRSRPARLGPVRLVAIDGPSGAGKTRFADRLGARLSAQVVHTDDLLDGWEDQFTFWARLNDLVLEPLRHGRPGSYLRYDWELGAFAVPLVTVEPADVVLLEGVSSARRAIRAELSAAVFVTAPPDVRLDRVLSRDGSDDLAFRAYLERWRTAEDRHFAEEATAAFADFVIDGSAGESEHDRLRQSPG
ncbi:MAG TPA: AAA family ATPase [Actinoplanes sp.]|nr:AAA family ATPase [Actinoplanes sp.]